MSHTMREVAKRAGVSPATVSRVLNKTRYISVETERRVLEVVGQMKYFKLSHPIFTWKLEYSRLLTQGTKNENLVSTVTKLKGE